MYPSITILHFKYEIRWLLRNVDATAASVRHNRSATAFTAYRIPKMMTVQRAPRLKMFCFTRMDDSPPPKPTTHTLRMHTSHWVCNSPDLWEMSTLCYGGWMIRRWMWAIPALSFFSCSTSIFSTTTACCWSTLYLIQVSDIVTSWRLEKTEKKPQGSTLKGGVKSKAFAYWYIWILSFQNIYIVEFCPNVSMKCIRTAECNSELRRERIHWGFWY